MRRLVLDAADAPRGPSAIWRQGAWVVAVAAVLLAVVFSAHPTPEARPSGGTLAANGETGDATVHQLQGVTARSPLTRIMGPPERRLGATSCSERLSS